MRSVWKSDLPPAVRVVAKNVRAHPVAFAGSEGREGFDIAGAKALHSFATAFGSTEIVSINSPCVRARFSPAD
jgi:hypothetical protein